MLTSTNFASSSLKPMSVSYITRDVHSELIVLTNNAHICRAVKILHNVCHSRAGLCTLSQLGLYYIGQAEGKLKGKMKDKVKTS